MTITQTLLKYYRNRRWPNIPLARGVIPNTQQGVINDAKAGIALASVNIPQVLGYTSIAGTPIVTGLYTVLLPLLGFALFGASRHLVVAADSATAAIFANGLSGMATPASAAYMNLVAIVALLTAGILLIARWLKLGFVADFLSRTILTGFLAGVGLQVSIAMLAPLLGIRNQTHQTHTTWSQLDYAITHLPSINLPTLCLGITVIAAILIGKQINPRFPVAMIAVLTSILAGKYLAIANWGIALIGPVPGGLPQLSWPDMTWHGTLTLIPLALSCAVIIIAQSAATARIYALQFQETEDENANILGLAAANAAAAVSGAFVVNGSPTQTAMAVQAGAQSQVAQIVFAGIVAIALMFLTDWLAYLPHAVLAAIVFTIAIGMIHGSALKAIYQESPGEFKLAIITAMTVALVGVEQGLLFAALLSLLHHVSHSYNPHCAILQANMEGNLVTQAIEPGATTQAGLIIYHFGADLFYANEHRFSADIHSLISQAATPVQCLIIDASAMTHIDYSAAQSLRQLDDQLQQQNITLLFARCDSALIDDLNRHHITEKIGAAHIFTTLHAALKYWSDACKTDARREKTP
ncbi:SulP family inorganic anion transporter [Deefgea piscis]|uniref:SulP family inorganic anion transporter n=1 Tax=Deefgea piscis TaxID=2739061 RepID=A0A6M8STZ4_9NEIS|nr:SulP family inorganic anion transporter [Deefgea piscis]QKJ67548.1 SulP family inorganic anion transporter [Deefgea piscis]